MTKPETMLAAAKIAKPVSQNLRAIGVSDWFILKPDEIYYLLDDPPDNIGRRGMNCPGQVAYADRDGGIIEFFKPMTNDSDWVALREKLEMEKNIDIYWSPQHKIYKATHGSEYCLPDDAAALMNKDPRQLALDIVEVISCE